MDITPSLTATTIPAPPSTCPPADIVCRCDDVAPWDQWVDPKRWTDSEGRECEQRSCAVCGCSVSRLVTPRIVDEPYDRGVPGRACTRCNLGWPASEPDGAPWHHHEGCPFIDPTVAS